MKNGKKWSGERIDIAEFSCRLRGSGASSRRTLREHIDKVVQISRANPSVLASPIRLPCRGAYGGVDFVRFVPMQGR